MSTLAADGIQAALVAYALEAVVPARGACRDAVTHALIDTVAVALGALSHPAAIAARRYARHVPVASGATVWGTGQVTLAETAALANGVPLRGYDFNDLYIGRCGGHPSDIIPGLVALAEQRRTHGRQLVEAIAVGYEVCIAFMDTIDLKAGGWDYPNITAIAAACAAARLLGLDAARAGEALAITVIPHFASLEPESGELNAQGDLTMWKRFNGSDAVRHAVHAVLLAEAGVEGTVRPFEGRHGFWRKVQAGEAERAQLIDRLHPRNAPAAVTRTTFKRWPVGSRAQSAIQAALAARRQVADAGSIREVRVFTDAESYRHLVSDRSTAWRPNTRETADHSLPYIVSAAVLDAKVDVSSFEPARVCDEALQQFMLSRVKVSPSDELSQGASAGFLTRVEIEDSEGRVFTGAAKPPPGHPLQPFTAREFDDKFMECVTPVLGAGEAHALLAAIRGVGELDDVSLITRLAVAPALQEEEQNR